MDVASTFAKSFSRNGIAASADAVYQSLEDTADRWNYSYSFIILCLMATISTVSVYFYKFFECTTLMAPPSGSNIQQYLQAACWTHGTIAVRNNDTLPMSPEEWDVLAARGTISFYQWVPFCLAVQAMLFLIPHLIWDYCASRTFGEDMNLIVERAIRVSKASDDLRPKIIKEASSQITRICENHMDGRDSRLARTQRWMHQRVPGARLFMVGKRLGNRMAFYYVMTKVLYIINLVGQMFLIREFLTYGREDALSNPGGLVDFTKQLMTSLSSMQEWEGGGSVFFPRKTYCTVHFRHLGAKNNRYLASCSLPVNMYTEKMYVFLWVWMIFVLGITVLSCVMWVINLFAVRSNEQFVKRLIDYPGVPLQAPCCMENLKLFVDDCIRSDGVLILRMVKINAGAIVSAEICAESWNMYFRKNPPYEDRNGHATAPMYPKAKELGFEEDTNTLNFRGNAV